MAIGLALVGAVIFAYAWGVGMGYGWGRVMTAIERRELEAYRRLAIDIADAPNRETA